MHVTSFDPLRIYLFDDGLVRFATCKYVLLCSDRYFLMNDTNGFKLISSWYLEIIAPSLQTGGSNGYTSLLLTM